MGGLICVALDKYDLVNIESAGDITLFSDTNTYSKKSAENGKDNHVSKTIHPRLFTPGQASTKQEHLPPNAKFYLEHTSDWCLENSKRIGPSCQFVIENLLTDPVRDLLHQAQSIMKLEKTMQTIP